MKVKQILAKSCILAFVFLLGFNVTSKVVYAYDYGTESTVVNNGGDSKMYTTDGGRYFQYAWQSTTEFGLKSRIREHKISQQPAGCNYWAYERGISFPEPLEIGTSFELAIDAYGYAYGSKMSAYNDLTQAQMDAKVTVYAEVTLANGRTVTGDRGIMGGYNDGQRPHYQEHYGYVYNTTNMPSWTKGQKIKSVYLKVTNAPTIPSSGDNRYRYLYLIDSMNVKVKSMTSPSNGRVYRTTSDNENKNILVDNITNGNVNSLWVRPQDSVQENGVLKPINLWMYTFQKQASSSVNRINKNYMKFVTTYNPNNDKVIDERYVIDENKGYSHYNDKESTTIINDGGHDFYRTKDTGEWEYCSKFRVGFDWDNVDYDVYIAGSSVNGKETNFEKKSTLKTDGVGPTVGEPYDIASSDINKATIWVRNVYDIRGKNDNIRNGVGMKDGIDGAYLAIWRADKPGNLAYLSPSEVISKGTNSLGSNVYDYKFEIVYNDSLYNSLDLKTYLGDVKFQVGTVDKLNNKSFGDTGVIRRADPTPGFTEVELLNWDYAEPNTNIKWAKTEKDINIRTKVKNNEDVNSILNIAPTGTKLYIEGEKGFWDDVRVSGIVEKSDTAEGIYNSNNYKAIECKEDGIHTLISEHIIKGRSVNNGKKYNLSTSGYLVYGGTKFETTINNKEVNNNILAFDGQAPVLLGGIPNSAWTKDNVQMDISFKDNESGIKSISLYKGSKKIKENIINVNSKSTTANIQYTESTEGIHNYRLVVVDNVGNTTEKTFTIKIDKTAPIIAGIPSDAWTNKDVTINLSATDALSGMKSLELFDHNNNKVASGVSSLSYKVNTTGKLKFKVIAKDNVGNTSEKYFIVKIDKTAPNINKLEDIKYKLNSSNYDLNINAEKIVEVESGINEIWGEFYVKGTNDRIKEVFKPSNTMLDIVKDLYNTKKGESKYDEKYDYNTDGIIDIYDIVKAAVKYTNYYPEDYNEDGLVDKKDLDIIRALNNVRYGEPKYHPKYDLNDDNIINSNDFAIVENKIGISSYYELDVNLAEILGTDKNIVVEVWGKDNVNNKRLLSQKEFNTMVTPDNVEVEITKAKYIDGNTYWVNGKDEFNIRTKGVSPDGFTRYPGVNNLFVGGNGIYQESYSGTKIEVTKNSLNMNNGSDNDKYISTYENYFAKEVISNGKYSLQVDHKLLAQDAANGMKFNLYTNAGTDYNNEMHYSKMGTTNQVLAVDTVAPKGTVSINYNNETLDMNVSANVSDNESGLKKVYIKYYPTDDISVAKYKDLDNVDGTYTTSFNTYEEFSSATEVKVEVIAVDNVDNERVLKSQEFDTFFVEAEILRVLSPSYPNFKEGEKGKLVIKVRGGVEKLKITFPYEFTILDNTVNKEITLEPKKEDQVIVEFFIPFEIENKSYQVKVEGYKKNKVKTVYPSFKVLGSITEEFRTRIRYK